MALSSARSHKLLAASFLICGASTLLLTLDSLAARRDAAQAKAKAIV
jgi:hypothetical protein